MINLLADFPAMALASDSVDLELVDRPRQVGYSIDPSIHVVVRIDWNLFRYADFFDVAPSIPGNEDQFRTGWFMVSIFTGLLILLAVRTRRPFFRSRPSRLLLVAVASVATVTVALPTCHLAEC